MGSKIKGLSLSNQPLTELISGRGFDRYQSGLKSRFRAYGLDYHLTYCQPTDNPAMVLDFESQLHLGRITVWESGLCDLEMLDIASGAIVFSEHHELKTEGDFHEVLPRLPILMRDALKFR